MPNVYGIPSSVNQHNFLPLSYMHISYRSFQIVPEVTEPDDFKPTEAPVAPNNEAAEARFDSASVSGCLNYKGESVPYILNKSILIKN